MQEEAEEDSRRTGAPRSEEQQQERLQEEAQGKSCLVVEKRAEKVAAEYVRKAQRTDQTYCGTAPGTVGPVEARLRTFDKTVPLVFGAFGEASSAVIEK